MEAIVLKQTDHLHMDYKICIDTMSFTWRSENNLWVPVPLFHDVGPWD